MQSFLQYLYSEYMYMYTIITGNSLTCTDDASIVGIGFSKILPRGMTDGWETARLQCPLLPNGQPITFDM